MCVRLRLAAGIRLGIPFNYKSRPWYRNKAYMYSKAVEAVKPCTVPTVSGKLLDPMLYPGPSGYM